MSTIQTRYRGVTEEKLTEMARQVLNDKNMTMVEAADRLDVSQPAISQALNPNLRKCRKLRLRIVTEIGGMDARPGYIVPADAA